MTKMGATPYLLGTSLAAPVVANMSFEGEPVPDRGALGILCGCPRPGGGPSGDRAALPGDGSIGELSPDVGCALPFRDG